MKLIAGTDEVGLGAWAGPIVAVTVAMPFDGIHLTPDGLKTWWPLREVNDSKKLTAAQREYLRDVLPSFIIQCYGEVGIGISTVTAFNEKGHVYAWDTALADSVRKATKSAGLKPDLLLVDGTRRISGYPWPQRAEPKADKNYFLVAAASIIAKILRDDIMQDLHKQFPKYDWANNKGYGTRQHEQALLKYGMTPQHRVQACQTALKRITEQSKNGKR